MTNNSSNDLMVKVVSLMKRRGFVFPSSQLYGGLGGFYDFGPLGVQMIQQIKQFWWQKFVNERADVCGLDSSIILATDVWKSSGHLDSFSDPLVECMECKQRYRVDHLPPETVDCPDCKSQLGQPRDFNLMFATKVGAASDSTAEVYLRPETAQGIFINFELVRASMRAKLPFGIAQIGKAFRNEITFGHHMFRVREFEQLELEFFVKPTEDDKFFKYWQEFCQSWLTSIGVSDFVLKSHSGDELSHYAKATVDIEFNYPWGQAELWGIANRQDYDLKQHSEASGQDLRYFDPETNTKYFPYVIEPSLGVSRVMLAALLEAYNEVGPDNEVVLKLDPKIAPVQVAILPLMKKPALVAEAQTIFKQLSPHFLVQYDQTGSVGKRYRRQDEIGTPYCLTVDFDTLDDQAVTIRDRDSREQERVKVADLVEFLKAKIV